MAGAKHDKKKLLTYDYEGKNGGSHKRRNQKLVITLNLYYYFSVSI